MLSACLDIREKLIEIKGLVEETHSILHRNGKDYRGEPLNDDLYCLDTVLTKCFSSLYDLEEEIWQKENR